MNQFFNKLKQNWLGLATLILIAFLFLHNLYLQTQIEIMQRKLTCIYGFLDKLDDNRGGRANPCSLEYIFN